jgi:hypothetical protein
MRPPEKVKNDAVTDDERSHYRQRWPQATQVFHDL